MLLHYARPLREAVEDYPHEPAPLRGDQLAMAQRRYPSWVGLSGQGIELVAAVVGLTLLGYWFDLHFATTPTATIIGAILGLVGGMLNFVRAALAATRRGPDDRDGQGSGSGDNKRVR